MPLSSDEPPVKLLAEELGYAYDLIECAVPLALRMLKNGGASLEEQRSFWWSVDRISHYVDLLPALDDTNPFGEPEYPTGLNQRMEQLVGLLHPEEPELCR
jgi:hypothetical protein